MAGAPTILQRLGLTQADLEAKYDEVGNLRLLAEILGVSKTTLQKYLHHKSQHTKPWDSVKKGEPTHNMDYLRLKFRKAAMQSFEQALLHHKTWKDITGRVIPREAVQEFYVEPPRKMSPIMPIYATLKGSGQTVIFMFHPTIDWITEKEPVSHQQEEHSSTSEDHHTSRPAPSDQSLERHSSPSDSQEQTD